MRKINLALKENEIEKILLESEYGVLGTISKNGYPYTVPISYVFIDDSIYFHGSTSGHKIENINENNKVSFTIVSNTKVLPSKFTTEYDSVIIFGTACVATEAEKKKALDKFICKYSPEYLSEGAEYIRKASHLTNVIKISIDHITGKSYKGNK